MNGQGMIVGGSTCWNGYVAQVYGTCWQNKEEGAPNESHSRIDPHVYIPTQNIQLWLTIAVKNALQITSPFLPVR